MKAIITVGTSASGKSTFTETLDNSWLAIERDKIRQHILVNVKKLCNTSDNIWAYWNFKWEKEVDVIVDNHLRRAFQDELNVIFSDTNLHVGRRMDLKLKLEELGYEIEIKVFGLDLTFEELCKRDTYRKNSVGYATIGRQYEQFRQEFPKYQLKDVLDKSNVLICDIDGTCAIMGDRSPYEWDKVKFDLHNNVVFSFLEGFCSNTRYVDEIQPKIIFMSGRDSICREDTIKWIDSWMSNNAGFEYELYMRAEGDMRKDTIVKEELFFEYVDGKYNVQGVLDDRNCVVHLWMNMGLKVYHCGNPYINF